MKRLTFSLVLSIIAISCVQKNPGESASSTKNMTSSQLQTTFADPQRLQACRQFMVNLMHDDLSVALSMMDMTRTTDLDLNDKVTKDQKARMEAIYSEVSKHKLSPENTWIVRFDTSHFLVHKGVYIIHCMNLRESILIPVDRGPERVDSHLFVHLMFDLTDMHPAPDIIVYAGLEDNSIFSVPTNHQMGDY